LFALSEEIYATGLYDRNGADQEADNLLPELLAYATEYDAAPLAPVIPEFAVGDLVQITDIRTPTQGMTGYITCAEADDMYRVALGGGFSATVHATGLRLSLRRFATPEQVREMAQRGPSEITRRFGTIFLGDGSQWEQQDDGRVVLAFPPYNYPRPSDDDAAGCAVPTPAPTPDSDTGMAIAEAQARALWNYRGTASDLIEFVSCKLTA
jgi:hypothetical protein